MAFLLDVNVLIALIDEKHVDHARVHAWFGEIGFPSWATCPLTQNGVLRIVGSSSYSRSNRSPGEVLEVLEEFCDQPGHVFWPDSLSLFDRERIEPAKLLYSKQVTDTYLLALAVANGGQFATLDHRLLPAAVVHGVQALCLIP